MRIFSAFFSYNNLDKQKRSDCYGKTKDLQKVICGILRKG